GNTRGIELALNTQPASWWYLKGGYTYLYKNLRVREGSKDLNGGSAESNDPQHQLVIQSNIKLPQHLEFGTVIRYIGNLPKPYVSEYVGLDARIGWKIYRSVELNLVAQNLLDKLHTEFIPSSPSAREIPRSIYGKITCYF
ncbi:MAG TPA: hypothetical protein VJ279_01915, partial [Hanamia sp.]|nr:hypothetical protein [Hanamia sp.]